MKEISSVTEREQHTEIEDSKLEYLGGIIEDCDKLDSYGLVQSMSCQCTGRVVEVTPRGDEDRMTVRSPSGQIELTVRLTAEGPSLLFQGVDIQLSGTKDVSINCDTFQVDAKKAIRIESRGDLSERIEGRAVIEAKSVEVRATLGSVSLDANDDVALTGERIFLNK